MGENFGVGSGYHGPGQDYQEKEDGQLEKKIVSISKNPGIWP